MSTLKVANVNFNSTGSNRIDYINDDNIIRVTSGAVKLPVGVTLDRPAAEEGLIRYNSETGGFEGRNATAWGAIGGSADLTPAFLQANTARVHANNAYAKANSGPVIANDSLNATRYIVFGNGTTGTLANANVATALTFNPSTGTLSSTLFNSTSDINKKDNIVKVADALDILYQIDGVRFTWKDNGLPSLGVIAQQVEKVLPELVESEKSVNYNGLIAVLIEAVKELKAEIEELKKNR